MITQSSLLTLCTTKMWHYRSGKNHPQCNIWWINRIKIKVFHGSTQQSLWRQTEHRGNPQLLYIVTLWQTSSICVMHPSILYTFYERENDSPFKKILEIFDLNINYGRVEYYKSLALLLNAYSVRIKAQFQKYFKQSCEKIQLLWKSVIFILN